MELIKLFEIKDEEAAEKYLLDKGILKKFSSCPECNYSKIYRVRGKKYKCAKCGYEWSVRKDSVLYGIKVPFLKFVLAIKLFELKVSVRQASKQLGLSYNTTHKIFKIIRQKIYQHCSKGDVLKGEVEGG